MSAIIMTEEYWATSPFSMSHSKNVRKKTIRRNRP